MYQMKHELLKIIDKIILDESEAVDQAKSNPQTINLSCWKSYASYQRKSRSYTNIKFVEKTNWHVMMDLSLEDIEFIKILAISDSTILQAGMNDATRKQIR